MTHTCTKHQPGAPTCYRDCACRCTDCRREGNRFGKQCRAGLTRRVPAGLIAEHLRRLHITDLEAARRAGLTQTTVTRIRTGYSRTVLRSTAAALLALTPAEPVIGTLSAAGTIRRLRGLAALGYTSRQIADSAGLTPEYARKLIQGGRPTVIAATAVKARAVADRLGLIRPKGWMADRQRREAAAKGWLPLLAWDDDSGPHGIDNPEATPHDWQRTDTSVGTKPDELIEALEMGADLASLVSRYHIAAASIERALHRAGRSDLWQRIAPKVRAA